MILKRKYLENKKIILQCFTCDYLFLFDRKIMDLQKGCLQKLNFFKRNRFRITKTHFMGCSI